MARKAGALLVGWIVSILGCIALGIRYPILLGVAAGAIATAVVLLLAVRWSMQSMMEQTMQNIDEMDEVLDGKQPGLFDDEFQ